MSEKTLKALAFLVGAIMAVMVIFNTMLGTRTTNEVSITINQIVSIIVLSLILALFRNNNIVRPKPGRVPWYLRFGGLFGLVVMACNYFSVLGTGTTVAMAATVFGQCLVGLLFDLTGLMGMKKRPVTPRKLLSLLVSLIGIVIMIVFSSETFALTYVLLAALAGAVCMVQLVYNSFLSSLKGPFYSALNNAASGFIGIVLFSFLVKPGVTIDGFRALPSVAFPIIVGGGLLALTVVVLSNTLIPKIPGAVSSILMASGQILAGLPLDYLLFRRFTPSLLAGALVMVLGLFLDRES